MDTFIDKLAQKNIADDMIKANGEAEAKESQRIKEQIGEYEQLLSEMKQVNLKNIESAQRVSDMLAEADLTKSDAPVAAGVSAEDMAEIKRTFEESSAEIIRNTKEAVEEIKLAYADTKAENADNGAEELKVVASQITESATAASEQIKTSADDAVAKFADDAKATTEESVAAVKDASTEVVNNIKSWSTAVLDEVKISTNDGIENLLKSSDEAVEKIIKASEDAIAAVSTASEEAMASLTASTEALRTIEETADEDDVKEVDNSELNASAESVIENIKETCEAGVSDIKQATDNGVYDLKMATDATLVDIKDVTSATAAELKQAAIDGVADIKKASEDATAELKQVISEGLEALKQAAGGITTAVAPEMDRTYLDAQFDDVHDAIHSENVKVYRNVQAAVDDSLADQTKAIRGYIERETKDNTKVPVMLGVVNFGLNIIILLVIILKTLGVF